MVGQEDYDIFIGTISYFKLIFKFCVFQEYIEIDGTCSIEN